MPCNFFTPVRIRGIFNIHPATFIPNVWTIVSKIRNSISISPRHIAFSMIEYTVSNTRKLCRIPIWIISVAFIPNVLFFSIAILLRPYPLSCNAIENSNPPLIPNVLGLVKSFHPHLLTDSRFHWWDMSLPFLYNLTRLNKYSTHHRYNLFLNDKGDIENNYRRVHYYLLLLPIN